MHSDVVTGPGRRRRAGNNLSRFLIPFAMIAGLLAAVFLLAQSAQPADSGTSVKPAQDTTSLNGVKEPQDFIEESRKTRVQLDVKSSTNASEGHSTDESSTDLFINGREIPVDGNVEKHIISDDGRTTVDVSIKNESNIDTSR